MKSIWKFPLKVVDEQKVLIPKTAKTLSVQTQYGTPCIWVLADTEEERIERTFVIHGTGHPCVCEANEFIGTFQIPDANLVFHLFEKGKV